MKRTSVRIKEQSFDKENSAIQKIKTIFFKYPTREFTLSEIARIADASKSTVSKIIAELRKNNFVTIIDLKVVYRIRANLESSTYKKEKIASNISNVICSSITETLAKKFNSPKYIVFFGSYSKGEDDLGSDIDIAVEVPEGEKTGLFKYDEFNDLENMTQRNVVVHVFTKSEVDKNLFANIVNGLVLYGFLEVNK